VALLSSRYDAGDRAGVWDELHSLHDVNALEPQALRDVEEVVVATIRRAVSNLRTIYHRLVEARFVFEDPTWAEPSGQEGLEIRDLLAANVGPIPIVLGEWLEHVTLVSFRGRPLAPAAAAPWKRAMLDPFEFVCSQESVEADLENRDEAGRFDLPFAADTYIKNDISGGRETRIRLPATTVDARVFESNEQSTDAKGIWFVDYLRLYFESGGFRRTMLSARDAADCIPIPVGDLLPI
jgi:hypothetical protein